MPRISKELSEQKKNFVIAKFKENPAFTIREIQEFLKVQFAGIKGGETMNPATVLSLRNGPSISQGSPIVSTEPPTEAIGTTMGSTETIVTPEPSTEGIISPVVQVAAPKPQPEIVPVEGETYRVESGFVQITDATGTYIRKVEKPQPVVEA